jgi:hypothetical protein
MTAPTWQTVETIGKPHARHEAAFVGLGSKLYLLGGRRIQPVDIYDPATKTWTEGKAPPVETHHFQPVVWENKIWLPGAMTGGFPRERALAQIPVYDPASDSWSEGPALPADRRRGGSGAIIHDAKLYVVCGIINGHWDGHVAWFDVLDLKTNEWPACPTPPALAIIFKPLLSTQKSTSPEDVVLPLPPSKSSTSPSPRSTSSISSRKSGPHSLPPAVISPTFEPAA